MTLEPIEKAAARERMPKAATVRKLSHLRGWQDPDKIGAFAGISGRTVEKIAAVVAAAEAEPEKFGKLLEDMDRTGRVNGALPATLTCSRLSASAPSRRRCRRARIASWSPIRRGPTTRG